MTSQLFSSGEMGAAYARWRPAVHPYVVGRIRERLALTELVDCAVDVGCGAGLSTKPLLAVARTCIGIDPFEPMVRTAARVSPAARFVRAAAEALPFPHGSVDLLTAAGSLNYADLDRFFPEAARVLRPKGALVVYDFSQGRNFADSPVLGAWFEEFEARYPRPKANEIDISPETLGAGTASLVLQGHETFRLPLLLAPEFYVEYVMTETNVAHAIATGTSPNEIRSWCTTTLGPVFENVPREVVFDGYLAWLHVAKHD